MVSGKNTGLLYYSTGMSYEMPALEDESFVPSEGDGNNEFAPAAEEGGLTNAAASTEGPQSNNGQQVERRNKRVSLYWKRPKSHLYEYNYDYGSNYYKVSLPTRPSFRLSP